MPEHALRTLSTSALRVMRQTFVLDRDDARRKVAAAAPESEDAAHALGVLDVCEQRLAALDDELAWRRRAYEVPR